MWTVAILNCRLPNLPASWRGSVTDFKFFTRIILPVTFSTRFDYLVFYWRNRVVSNRYVRLVTCFFPTTTSGNPLSRPTSKYSLAHCQHRLRRPEAIYKGKSQTFMVRCNRLLNAEAKNSSSPWRGSSSFGSSPSLL